MPSSKLHSVRKRSVFEKRNGKYRLSLNKVFSLLCKKDINIFFSVFEKQRTQAAAAIVFFFVYAFIKLSRDFNHEGQRRVIASGELAR